MPLTSYCKKCASDVPVSETCPHCGAKLPASAIRLAWCVDHTPVRDWMCWNAVMRIVLPMLAVMTLLMMVLQAGMVGLASMAGFFSSSALLWLVGLSALFAAVVFLVLLLQGDDVLDCVMDSKGLHIRHYLPSPTPLKLLLRLKSPRLITNASPDEPLLLIHQHDLTWRDVARIQLWPEKTLMLFYAPAWWLRLPLPCTPFTWQDALDLTREKLGRRKDVSLPPELIAAPKAKSSRKPQTQQLTMDDLPSQPEALTGNDLVPLDDLLQELKNAQDKESASPS